MGLSKGAEWILNFVQEIADVRADPEGSWSTKHILFLSFLVCDADWSYLKKTAKNVLAMGLFAWAEWILNFVQEIAGVSTDPERSSSGPTKQILFPSFLVCDAKTGPT